MNRGRSSIADRPPRRHADDEPMGTVPPLAGISDYPAAARDGVSVDETVTMLRRLARIERRTLLVLAAHVGAVPEWEVKCALSLHLWQDAEHCAGLRERVPELRKPPHYLDRPDDPALDAFFEELIRSRTTRELLTGVYGCSSRACSRRWTPTVVAVIRSRTSRPSGCSASSRSRSRSSSTWGEAALAALGGPDEEWERHLGAYLRCGGRRGRQRRPGRGAASAGSCGGAARARASAAPRRALPSALGLPRTASRTTSGPTTR